MSLNTPSSAPAENTPTLPLSPVEQRNALKREVELGKPKPKSPPEDTPAVPFASETVPVVGAKPPEVTNNALSTPAEAKLSMKDRLKEMGSNFGVKIEQFYEGSKDTIQNALKTVGEFVGVDKMKGWAEKMIAKLQGDGIFATLFGGKGGWAEKLVSMIFGIGDAVAAEVPEKKFETYSEQKYNGVTTVLSKFFREKSDENKNAVGLYNHEKIKDAKYGDLRKIYEEGKDKTNFGYKEKLGITGTTFTDNDCRIVLASIFDGKHGQLIRDTLSRQFPNEGRDQKINEMPLGVVLTNVADHFISLKFISELVDVDPSNIKNNLGKAFYPKTSEDGKVTDFGGYYAERASRFFSKEAMISLFTSTYGDMPFIDKENAIKSMDGQNLSERQKQDMMKLFDFAEGYKKLIIENKQLNLGLGHDIAKVFDDKKGFSYQSLMTLYVMMDGKTDWANMTALEKINGYASMMMVLGSDEKTFGKSIARYMDKLSDDASDIPQDVKDVMWLMTKKVASTTGNAIGSTLSTYFGFTLEKPLIGLGLIAGGLLLPILPAKKRSVFGLLQGK